MFLPFFAKAQEASTITCGSTSCISSGSANIQEKANYTAIDLGFPTAPFSVVSDNVSPTVRDVRMSLNNGGYPGNNLTINLSSSVSGRSSGNVMVFADNIDAFNISLNGYSGKAGKDASELCATKVLGGQYGEATKSRFLARRAGANPPAADRCTAQDLSDIATNSFSCNDPTYKALDPQGEPAFNSPVTRVRQVSLCTAVIPQKQCYQKTYDLTCRYTVGIKLPSGAPGPNTIYGPSDRSNSVAYAIKEDTTFVQFNSWLNNRICECKQGDCSVPGINSENPGHSYNYFKRDGAVAPLNYTYTRRISQEEFDKRLAQYNSIDGVCQSFTNNTGLDPELQEIKTNKYSAQISQQGNDHVWRGTLKGWACPSSHFLTYHTTGADGNLSWIATGFDQPVETSPGLTESKLALVDGGEFLIRADSNGASRQTNPNGWKFDVMPAFAQCNDHFTEVGKVENNIGKSVYDPDTYSEKSFYCKDPTSDVNCSLNKPYCDDPSSPENCNQVNACEKVNRKLCVNVLDRSNCTQPPFCDDPLNPENCSPEPFAKSCNDNDFYSHCDSDPNNLASYVMTGSEADPDKTNLETLNCTPSTCPVQHKSVESTGFIDTLTPTNGENGTFQGRGLVFVYDIRSVNASALPGQAGRGGRIDLSNATEIRYCSSVRDAISDPTGTFQDTPEVVFKKVFWKPFDIKQGGQPGEYPSYSTKEVEIFKKLDPAVRYLLKKELM